MSVFSFGRIKSSSLAINLALCWIIGTKFRGSLKLPNKARSVLLCHMVSVSSCQGHKQGRCAGVLGSTARDVLRLLAHGVGAAQCHSGDDD